MYVLQIYAGLYRSNYLAYWACGFENRWLVHAWVQKFQQTVARTYTHRITGINPRNFYLI